MEVLLFGARGAVLCRKPGRFLAVRSFLPSHPGILASRLQLKLHTIGLSAFSSLDPGFTGIKCPGALSFCAASDKLIAGFVLARPFQRRWSDGRSPLRAQPNCRFFSVWPVKRQPGELCPCVRPPAKLVRHSPKRCQGLKEVAAICCRSLWQSSEMSSGSSVFV